MTDTVEVGNALLGIAGVQLAAGALYAVSNAARRRGRVRIEGAIVDHEVLPPDEDGVHYEPIVEYVTPTGERRRLKYGAAFSKPKAVDGSERRVVWHDPSDPGRSHVDLKLRSALPVPMPVLFLLPFVVLAVGLALRFGALSGALK